MGILSGHVILNDVFGNMFEVSKLGFRAAFLDPVVQSFNII
jgi:hypothetical protein